MLAVFGQSFDVQDLAVVGLLIILEGVLSIDNALVLGLLAKRLPKHQQRKALTYGLIDSFVLRLIAIMLAAYLLHWKWVKIMGGVYLIYVALKHFVFEGKEQAQGQVGSAGGLEGQTLAGAAAVPDKKYPRFWPTVLLIEMTDIAFAVDSILAAIAMIPATDVSPNPKLWVVFTGGMLGVILMRFAAVIFIRLLERFPRFELSAYLLVLLIGTKLLVDWGFNSGHEARIKFHSPADPAFWIFWLLMLLFFSVGFLPPRRRGPEALAESGDRTKLEAAQRADS